MRDHPTGTVKVEVDRTGQPRFEISESVAWDFLEWTPQWQTAGTTGRCRVLWIAGAAIGSTAAPPFANFCMARAQMRCGFSTSTSGRISLPTQVLAESMKLATIVKLNHEELPRIMRLFELEHRGEEDSARRLLSSHDLKLVCVTRGNGGSLLVSADETQRTSRLQSEGRRYRRRWRRFHRGPGARISPGNIARANQRNRQPRRRVGRQPVRRNASTEGGRLGTNLGRDWLELVMRQPHRQRRRHCGFSLFCLVWRLASEGAQ